MNMLADGNAHAVRAYLIAVYPEASALLHRLSPRQLERRFAALDYYYSLSESALSSVQPHLALHRSLPVLPYLPAGAYYKASGEPPLDLGRFNAILWGSFERHRVPVTELAQPLVGTDHVARFHSSFGARMGPQPSWTSPLAIVRYVHYPNGLEPLSGRQHSLRKAVVDSVEALPFEVANSSSVARLRGLRDGDTVEVELWGGLLGVDECPPICGLWANVWHGTGILMRVRAPFVSLSKATAITEMLAVLGARNASALEVLLEVLGATSHVSKLRIRHPSSTLADCIAAYMLATVPNVGGHHPAHFAQMVEAWDKLVRRSTPGALVSHALQLGSRPEEDLHLRAATRFALYWTFSAAGKARNTPFWRGSPVGPDGLLATLACMLGHKTVVLSASANDNGLLHQELVDFELPGSLGWPVVTGSATNDASWCLRHPFAFLKEDAKRGPQAQLLRRVQLLSFWRESGKFRLPTDPTGGPSQPTYPCEISFGHGGASGAGELGACRGPKVRVPRPSAAKACWAWCNRTLSASLATVSLGHTRGPVHRRPSAAAGSA
jgi:hypothetical protein